MSHNSNNIPSMSDNNQQLSDPPSSLTPREPAKEVIELDLSDPPEDQAKE